MEPNEKVHSGPSHEGENSLSETSDLMTSQAPPSFQLTAAPLQLEGEDDVSNIDKLKKLLRDDDESGAITLMGTLSSTEVDQVLRDTSIRDLAYSAFGNAEMAQAMTAMKGDALRSLQWMFGEGVNWDQVKTFLEAGPKNKTALYGNNTMKDNFVGICGNEDMAKAVDLIGGTLAQKLEWMAAEGSSWKLIEEKISATTDANQKLALYNNDTVRDLFVSERTNEQIASAVDLLGGTLLQKLLWMKAEGSNWELVKAKITATTDPAEKTALYANTDARALFVDVCTNKTMADAVDLLGGTLIQKLRWMKAEGSSWELVKKKITATTNAGQKSILYGNSDMKNFFIGLCTNETMTEAVKLLGGTLNQKLSWMAAEGTSIEYVGDVIRNTAKSELAAVVADTTLLDALKGELSSSGYTTMMDMLQNDLLMQEDFTNTVDTGWSTTANMRHTRSEITVSKAINWVEKGTFSAGGFAAMKTKGNNAVGTYLDNKFKVKIEPQTGGSVSPADGLYPIRVTTTESSSGLDIELIGGQHGRSNATTYYELGQAGETTLPNITFGHELAHSVLGLSDEYTDPRYPSRVIHTDNSLMGNFYSEGISTAALKPRHFEWLANNIKKYYPDRKITIVP